MYFNALKFMKLYTKSLITGKVLHLEHFIISRRALAQEGDYEMMPVCACVRVCMR